MILGRPAWSGVCFWFRCGCVVSQFLPWPCASVRGSLFPPFHCNTTLQLGETSPADNRPAATPRLVASGTAVCRASSAAGVEVAQTADPTAARAGCITQQARAAPPAVAAPLSTPARTTLMAIPGTTAAAPAVPPRDRPSVGSGRATAPRTTARASRPPAAATAAVPAVSGDSSEASDPEPGAHAASAPPRSARNRRNRTGKRPPQASRQGASARAARQTGAPVPAAAPVAPRMPQPLGQRAHAVVRSHRESRRPFTTTGPERLPAALRKWSMRQPTALVTRRRHDCKAQWRPWDGFPNESCPTRALLGLGIAGSWRACSGLRTDSGWRMSGTTQRRGLHLQHHAGVDDPSQHCLLRELSAMCQLAASSAAPLRWVLNRWRTRLTRLCWQSSVPSTPTRSRLYLWR